jgi:hypothetical protein
VSFYSSLNRRRKAVVFVVLIGAGASLMDGASLGNGLGIVLVGIAVAWAVGSNCRPVHVALLLGSIILALGGPILVGWIDQHSAIVSYQSAVTKNSERMASFMTDQEAEHKRYEQEADKAAQEKNPPEIYELSEGLVRPAAPKEPPAFSLTTAFSDHWRWMLPGFLLACLGLALVVGVKTRVQLDRGQS